jgi:malonyl-CoA/methylmalonyl-CoA synthetase
LGAQVRCLMSAWQWAPSDCIAHALPLHHVHGIVNALYCPHYVGAAVNFLPKFSPAGMWQQLLVSARCCCPYCCAASQCQ